jgi:hypothetical protein
VEAYALTTGELLWRREAGPREAFGSVYAEPSGRCYIVGGAIEVRSSASGELLGGLEVPRLGSTKGRQRGGSAPPTPPTFAASTRR